MDGTTLYKSIRLSCGTEIFLDYYIVTESISASYCDLKRYGIKIERTTLYEGGGKIIEAKQINNVFYRECDAVDFIKKAASEKTEPDKLGAYMRKYIAESIDRARQKA